MRRRDLLRDVAVLVPLAAACAPARPSTPTSTPQPAAAAFRTPMYIPFQGPAPDIPGDANGRPPAYNTFPKNLVTSVAQPPGKGGTVNILTFTNAPAPPGVEQNDAWQTVNSQIGATLKINAVAAPDYLTKLNTSISGGDLADIFYASVIGTGLQNMPDFLSSQCADLTPFLSGDAVKDYPNLAAFPTFRWRFGTFNGKLYAIPAATITGQALLAKGRILDEAGIGEFKNTDDFMSAAKQLTRPGVQYAIGGTGSGYNSWNPLGWFMGVFRVPNDWHETGGKLTKDIETDEFKAALAYVRSLWDAGVMNPDSPSMNLTQAAAAWYSGKNVLWQNSYFSFQLAWDRAKLQSQDPDFRPRIVAPFAFDGRTAVHLLGSTSDSLTVFRRASDDRIRELLGIVNFMVAPFGTREYLLLNYGVQDRNIAGFDLLGHTPCTVSLRHLPGHGNPHSGGGPQLMRLRLLSLACALGLLATLVAAPLAASAAPTTTNPLQSIPVTGTTGNGGTFTGTLSITSFAVQNGQLLANGILNGTAVDPLLGTKQVTNLPVTLPAAIGGTCQILDLTLGPLHLDLLGLVIDLNQVHLTITAQQGPGNLLGNLLCAVANLLNSNASTNAINQVVDQLNRALARL